MAKKKFLTANDDTYHGITIADNVFGLAGNDQIYGRGGDDKLDGGDGSDKLVGGDGNDTLLGRAGNDKLDGGDGNDVLKGSIGDDTLVGGIGNDDLDGGDGRDVLNGGDGRDVLNGDNGTDTLIGGDGNDILAGGGGNDRLVGGSGSDTLDYSKDALHGATAGIVLDFAIITVGENAGWSSATDGFGNVDYFKSIENAIGTKFADIITGDDVGRSLDGMGGNDTLTSGSGIDTLTGGNGNDTLIGGAGDDRLLGGSGSDTLDYSKDALHGATSGIVLDFTVITVGENAGWSMATDGFGNTDYFKDVEHVIGTAFADVMTGDALGISLDGKDGNDTLTGGSGDDTLIGGGGADRFIGGDGIDTLDFRYDVQAGGNSGISLTFDDNTEWSATTDGFGNTDYFKEVERVIGTNFNDTIVCGPISKSYSGLDGVDTIVGATGLLNDTVDFRGNLAEEGVIINLQTGVVTNDGFGNAEHYSYVENVYGSRFNDDLTPGGAYSSADGGLGDDILRSSSIYGQNFTGGGGADTFIFTLATAGAHAIYDYSRAEGDVIRLEGFGPMVFINSYEFSGTQAECVLYVNQFTTDAIIDADADGVADCRISVWKFGLDSSDFNFV